MSKRHIANAPLPIRIKEKPETASKGTTDAAVVPPRRKRPPKPVSENLRAHYTRRELLVAVPLCMASIDALEKRGIFPKRIVLWPTRRVVWLRAEIEAFLKERARNRVRGPRQTSERVQTNESA